MDNAIECCMEDAEGKQVKCVMVQESMDAVIEGQVKHVYLLEFPVKEGASSPEEFAARVGSMSESMCIRSMRRLCRMPQT